MGRRLAGREGGTARARGLEDRGICRTQALDAFQARKLASLVAQAVKASAYTAGDLGSIPGSGRSPGEGNGNPLQYSCLENPMDRGAR